MMGLEAVSIMVPPELRSYSLLGKLGGNTNMHRFVENLTLNVDIVEKPEKILTQLHDLAHLNTLDCKLQLYFPTSLVPSGFEPQKTIFYCENGNTTRNSQQRKKEYFLTKDNHLRPSRRQNKCHHLNHTAHFTTAQAFMMHL
ncbi:hypothetical protein O181_125594 [Austropuccinia psidii MF-1]|uniref:Uncharacterized protein n=1 Tax=Austropuccinia psidii MF-1 TaxID=1389203 RepID=A0A9Q3KUF0_9BASI|nr:hypothetical protein [Austropuccinia psidii MF-1]